MKSEGTCACILLFFSDFISFGPKFLVLRCITLFIWILYSLLAGLMLQIFGLRYIDFFLLLKYLKKRVFLSRRLVWPSSFYITENIYELCFLFHKKNNVSFLNSFVSKKIHISYFFSVSKVVNKICRFRRYIWCTFSFFINKNAKIKT